MCPSDWLLLAQTLILLGTGVVIYWYTRETQRLREVSSTQAELLRQQVETMRASLNLDIQEQLRTGKPFFRWHGGGTNLGIWTRQFYNEGGLYHTCPSAPRQTWMLLFVLPTFCKQTTKERLLLRAVAPTARFQSLGSSRFTIALASIRRRAGHS